MDFNKILLFSILGYGTALTFKSISDSDIDEIENYVRTEFYEDNVSRFPNEMTDETQLSNFFGDHTKCPSQFKFSTFEKAAIKSFSYYVKQIVDMEQANAGLDHFESTKLFPNRQLQRYFGEKQTEKDSNYDTRTHNVLNLLTSIANRNALRDRSGFRFNEEIKQFSTYVRMLAGPLAYQTIQNNLNLALPSLSATNRYIKEMHDNLVDGVLRCESLVQYLKKRNLPLIVSLSEDATRINGRVQYDSVLNEVIGFVLPIDDETGMPISHSFPARNCEEIIKHFSGSNSVAQYVNVIMAQPLANIRPFCLLLFSSDGKFTAEGVMKRWKFIANELNEVNINVLSFASDSDPRYNSAMRKLTGLGFRSNLFGNVEWFNSNAEMHSPFFVQDTIHIATKFRNIFLKTKPFPMKLPFGTNYYIQVKHLETLLENFSKDRHQLTASVLNAMDRQNFSSVERIYDDKVIELLESHVPESKGTVMFLKILRHIVESYRDINLSPLERIGKIWYSVSVLRIWRQSISSDESLKVGENFITQNAYTCVEMNAHALILIILYLKKNRTPNVFLPELFDSQPCEGFFGQIRSLSTTFSTVVNCSVKEIIARINRIHLQNDIAVNTSFFYPRVKHAQFPTNRVLHELPDQLEIYKQIEKSKQNAIQDSMEVGLVEKDLVNCFTYACQVTPISLKSKTSMKEDERHVSVSLPLLRREAIVLKNFAEKFVTEEVQETSPYVEVYRENERRIIIKKCHFAGFYVKIVKN